MTITINVTNVLGVERAAFEVDQIALVGGRNKSGKSSLIQAIGAACGEALIRGVRYKKDAAEIVHRGADRGAVVISNGSESIKVIYPSLTREGSLELGQPLAVGTTRFAHLSADDRIKALTQVVDVNPKRQDVVEALQKAEFSEAQINQALPVIMAGYEEHGDWDLVAATFRENALKLRGQWEAIAKQRWGAKKAIDWHPPAYDPDKERADEEFLKGTVKERQKLLEACIHKAGANAAQIHRLREHAAQIEPLKLAVEEAEAKATEAEAAAVEAARKRDAMPPSDDSERFKACPSCGVLLTVKIGSFGAFSVKPAPADTTTDPDELKQRRLAFASADGEARRCEAEAAAARAAATLARQRVQAAEKAKAELEELGDISAEDGQETVDRARQALADAEAKLQGYRDHHAAQDLVRKIENRERVFEVLSPEGMRRDVMQRELASFNGLIDQARQAAEMPETVEVDGAGEITMDGRPYRLCSESEQWRIDMLIQLAFAQVQEPKLMVFDRLDVLEPRSKPGVLRAIDRAGIPAVITAMAKDVDALPNIGAAGLGSCFWIEVGVLRTL